MTIVNKDELNLRAAGGSLLLGALENPNKMPFSGELTFLGVPSDQAPGGSGGRRVMIPVEVGEAAIPSLVGMPVNLAASMDDHDTDAVVGVITDAHIGEPTNKGTPIVISGHIFAKSFPDEAVAIKASQETLGFSYETAKTRLETGVYGGETVAIATTLVFTGAAILYKNAAAYQSTSLAAKGEQGMEELARTMLEAIADLKAYVDTRLDQFQGVLEKQDIEEKVEEIAEAVGESGVLASAETEEKPEAEPEASAEIAEEAPANEEVNVEAKVEQPELTAAIAQLSELIQTLKSEVDEIKAAASETAPQRRSADSTQLAAKFDDVKNEDTDVFASIDKRNLTVEQSMAEKLVAFTQVVNGK